MIAASNDSSTGFKLACLDYFIVLVLCYVVILFYFHIYKFTTVSITVTVSYRIIECNLMPRHMSIIFSR
jgi:hypothetical protein